VPEVHFYVSRVPEREGVPALGDVADDLRKLSNVSEVRANPSESVVAVSFEGGQDEQQEIERVIEEAGYEISRLSVRTDDLPRE
jgi:copper chaperone CopZ